MVLFTALIATGFTVGGLIAREIEPQALTFLRFPIAAAIFLVLVAAQGKLALPGLRSWLGYCIIGFLLAVFLFRRLGRCVGPVPCRQAWCSPWFRS